MNSRLACRTGARMRTQRRAGGSRTDRCGKPYKPKENKHMVVNSNASDRAISLGSRPRRTFKNSPTVDTEVLEYVVRNLSHPRTPCSTLYKQSRRKTSRIFRLAEPFERPPSCFSGLWNRWLGIQQIIGRDSLLPTA